MKIVLYKHNLKDENSNFVVLSSFKDYCFQNIAKCGLIIYREWVNNKPKERILFSRNT
jgi:hypothetical protein